MSIEQGIVDLLNANPQADRFLNKRLLPGPPDQDPKETYLVYRLTGQDEGHFLNGPDGVPRAHLMLEVWDRDPDRCHDAGKAVKDALNGFRGWSGGVLIKKLAAKLAGDDEERDESGDCRYWYRRRIEVTADFDESFPQRQP